MSRCFLFFVLSLSLLLPSLEPLAVRAQTSPRLDAGFNPHAILSDADLFSLDGWDAERIQRFLASKKSGLAQLQLADIDGELKRPADILWRVAGSYKISPQYLLVLLQKEQSLVEDASPSQKQLDWATGYAVCDSCSMNDPRIQDFKGFANQVEYAAKQHRERYLFQMLSRGVTIAGHAPGKSSLIDGVLITPVNQATAMLYSYTPHIHGNQNVWRIWRRWFSRTHPDGTILANAVTQERFLLRKGERRPLSPAVSASLISDPAKILQVQPSDLEVYPVGDPVAFPNFSLLETASGTRFLLVGEQKRKFASHQVFRALGFQEDELINASEEDLDDYAPGPDITSRSRYPLGLLAKDARGGFWYLENDVRHAIEHPIYLSLSFRGRPARLLRAADLSRFPIAEPYRLRDGELIRGTTDAAVYVIEHGKRRVIASEELFLTMGYQWNNVVSLPDAALTAYPLGDPLLAPWQAPASELPAPDAPPSITLSSSSL